MLRLRNRIMARLGNGPMLILCYAGHRADHRRLFAAIQGDQIGQGVVPILVLGMDYTHRCFSTSVSHCRMAKHAMG
jgi:hypothetical protein